MYMCLLVYRHRGLVATSVRFEHSVCHLKNVLDSRLYQFILFTFVLKPLHKIFFTNFTAKILWEKNL